MKTLRRILTVVAILLAGWLIYSLVSGEALSPLVILGILLVLFFALLLSKQRQAESSPQNEVEFSPSKRKSKNQHKSWISRND